MNARQQELDTGLENAEANREMCGCALVFLLIPVLPLLIKTAERFLLSIIASI